MSVAERQLSWVELEAGADLHVRLLYARVDDRRRSAGAAHRATGPEARPKPAVVSAFPGGKDWPAPVYARASAAGAPAGRPAPSSRSPASSTSSRPSPRRLKGRLDLLRDLVPIAVPETASALVAAAGIALLLSSWGVRRGQRHAWMFAVGRHRRVRRPARREGPRRRGSDGRARRPRLPDRQATCLHRRRRPTVDRPRARPRSPSGARSPSSTATATVLWFGRRTRPVGRPCVHRRRPSGSSASHDIAIPGRRGRFLTPTLGAVGIALVDDRRRGCSSGRSSARHTASGRGRPRPQTSCAATAATRWPTSRCATTSSTGSGRTRSSRTPCTTACASCRPTRSAPSSQRAAAWQRVPRVRRRPRLAGRGHGRRRELAADLPRDRHARPVRRRRGRRRRAPVQPRRRTRSRACARRSTASRSTATASSSTIRPTSMPRLEARAARADDREPARRRRARLLDDARPGVLA